MEYLLIINNIILLVIVIAIVLNIVILFTLIQLDFNSSSDNNSINNSNTAIILCRNNSRNQIGNTFCPPQSKESDKISNYCFTDVTLRNNSSIITFPKLPRKVKVLVGILSAATYFER